MLVGDTTKLLLKDNLVEQTVLNLEKQMEKIKGVYNGTEAYIKTLIKKGETSRIAGVIETQKTELDALIELTQREIFKMQELIYYVEYKERGEVIFKMKDLFENWQNDTTALNKSFDVLKSKF